ncbi:hypothetical protein DIPPA_58729 [Diplonema papillatum]|nr:hypothetical protein DIPPA_58729 [Diplonema papillatum]
MASMPSLQARHLVLRQNNHDTWTVEPMPAHCCSGREPIITCRALRSLPPYVVRLLFMYLPLNTLAVASRVCRVWHTTADDELIWKQHCLVAGLTEPLCVSWKNTITSFVAAGTAEDPASCTPGGCRDNVEGNPSKPASLLQALPTTHLVVGSPEVAVSRLKEISHRLHSEESVLAKVARDSKVLRESTTQTLNQICEVSSRMPNKTSLRSYGAQNAAEDTFRSFESCVVSSCKGPPNLSFSQFEAFLHFSALQTRAAFNEWSSFKESFPLPIYYDLRDSIFPTDVCFLPKTFTYHHRQFSPVFEIMSRHLGYDVTTCFQ